MKLKKLFLWALVLIILHVSASAYSSYLEYDDGTGPSHEIETDATIIIGYDKNTIPKNLVISEDEDVKIMDGAFKGCTSLRSVTLQGDITYIGSDAFKGCTSLKEINFGGTKGQWTFGLVGFNAVANNVTVHCSDGDAEPINKNAKKIVIPDGVTEISERAFKGCKSLESVTIPDGIRHIDSDTFEGCTSLRSITIPASITQLRFKDCTSLKEINFGGTKGQWTFGLVGFNAVANNVTVHCSDGDAEPINKNARKIVIPDGVTKIGYGAFEDCKSLESVTIPASITYIGYRAFEGCSSLKEISFGGTKGQWTFGLLGFNAVANNVTVHCSDGNAEPINKNERKIVIPDGVTRIDFDAFNDCESLKSVTIPASVTEISGYFSGGYSSNESGKEINFGGTKVQWTFELSGFNAVANNVTVHCSDGDAEPISEDARKIVIPDGVTKIGDEAFKGCEWLESVTIPASVTEIGYRAFYKCAQWSDHLSVTFTGSKEKLKKIKIGKENRSFRRANISCAYETEAERLAEEERKERLMSTIIAKISSGEKNIKLKGSYSDEELNSLNDAIAKAKQTIDLDLSNAQKMPNLEWLTSFSNIEKVRLPKGLGRITVSLEEAKKIVPHPESKNIIAKDGLLYTNMGKTVYAVLEDAKSYTIPEGTKEIKAYVFKDSDLESITLPKSLVNIWENAFEGCTKLKTVNYAGSKKDWKNIYINNDGKGNKLLHKAKFVYGEK